MADKEETIDNLTTFSLLLSEYNLVESTKPLDELLQGLRRKREDRGLSYLLQGLKFIRASSSQFIRGDVWDATELSVHLELDISLKENGNFIFGDVKESVVEIIYEAYLEENCELARGAWHLDFHLSETKEPEFIHPMYHFHHGGRKIKDSVENYGELVLMDTPRLMHPPLDIFLAIDFLISNFYEKRVWQDIRGDTRYESIIKKSQKNWWEQYYTQLGQYWSHNAYQGKQSVSICDLARLSNPHLY